MVVPPSVAKKGLGPVRIAAAGLMSSISGCGPSGLGYFGPKSEESGEGESVIQQPEGLEGLGRFGFILAKHDLWSAAGIFLRIRGGVGRLRKKTKLIKCAAALGAGAGGMVQSGTPQGAAATATAMATGARPDRQGIIRIYAMTDFVGAGRYAPSPSGDLHFGNLRTAVLAWLFARTTGRAFYLRVEDIDTGRSSAEAAARQIADLADLGLDWDGEVLYQSQRFEDYAAALVKLPHYECYCSRKEIAEASQAPHSIPGHYPGTCRNLTEDERMFKRAELIGQGRVPALRLRAEVAKWQIHDYYAGEVVGEVDDMVLRRGGSQPDWAYNLAVVVDDAYQGVDQVVRGDDLLSSAPRQAYLAHLLQLPVPEYVHVPLVMNAAGQRLSKRDGAEVTLRSMRPQEMFPRIAASLSYGAETPQELLKQFQPGRLSREPFVLK